MNILFINAYFLPETIAFTHLEQDIIEALLKAGHKVEVICPTPSRGMTDGEITKYKKIKTENLRGVSVRRFSAPRERSSAVFRALRYFWCNFREYRIAKTCREADAVFAVSTPPTQGLTAGKAAKKLGVPFVYSVQDLFPDSLVSSGLAQKDSFLYKRGEKTARKTYALCDKIIVISNSFKRGVLAAGADESKIITVGNWIDSDKVKPVPKEDNRLFGELGIDKSKFTVVYAGNLGASQGADVIFKAARLLKGREDIRFAVFGAGSEYAAAREYVRQNDLDNITLNPLQPEDRISEVYSLGDVALITGKKGVGATAMPSKTWSIMACNTPIIASFDKFSELAEVLDSAGGGKCVEPEEPQALADAIEEAFIERPQSSGRYYVQQHADKTLCAGMYVAALEEAFNQNDREN